ncbi:X-domain of DnaJ-containing-domain-containing protein [Radiomyces spectabilis]|uniref:X-domain of DnaJ-containing-domain-containing protein n=1 Tax=Radiomyces spectabilis TaxID=64574 RepID=UPI002220300F|nr:X-domain of DnaJ-containing-domain-containing protein [Radiomyces spectabilis]KAI8371442.1 X-domain of DnaJ-containing-domain-containing protein [Radiomyces spectabilis]
MSRIGTDENPIDKSYYELLDTYHPDKNQSEGAEEKFKEISEAYQVLSDPQLRAHYNKYGKDKDLAPDGGFSDPREFFQQMFGGDAFRSIIGDLAMGELFSESMEQDMQETGQDVTAGKPEKSKPGMTKEQREKLQQAQKERVKKLAENLIHKLSLYTDSSEGDEAAAAAFQEQIKIEAEKLKSESYGIELLHTIGYVYSSKAKHHLGMKGGELPSIFQALRQKKHYMKELWSVVKSAMDMQAVGEMLEKAEKEGMDQAERLKLEEDASNKTVSSKVRYKRAEALRMVGYIYKHADPDKPVSELVMKTKKK